VAARAILHACETPVRDLYVGTAGWLTSLAGALAPRLTDYAMEALAKPTQASSDPGRAERRDNLYEPKEDLSERSSLGGPRPRGRSLLLDAQMNPGKAAAVWRAWRRRRWARPWPGARPAPRASDMAAAGRSRRGRLCLQRRVRARLDRIEAAPAARGQVQRSGNAGVHLERSNPSGFRVRPRAMGGMVGPSAPPVSPDRARSDARVPPKQPRTASP
jgi:hypothetical protein